jgi:hypothetical protein
MARQIGASHATAPIGRAIRSPEAPLTRWAVLVVSLVLAGCDALRVSPPEHLFDDASFAAPVEPLRADDVFAASPAMKHYLATAAAAECESKGPQQVLFDALYTKGRLRLEYESEMTHNAAQAFAAASGNCLSLVIMTAAFAKLMDLAVTCQRVDVEDTWGRGGDVYLAIGRVNLTLATHPAVVLGGTRIESDSWTIDFLPRRTCAACAVTSSASAPCSQ